MNKKNNNWGTEGNTPIKHSPFFGWEWLKTPALLLILFGALGIFRVYAKAATVWIAFMKFPPVWSCWILIGCSVILMAIAVAARHARYRHAVSVEKHKNWRSF